MRNNYYYCFNVTRNVLMRSRLPSRCAIFCNLKSRQRRDLIIIIMLHANIQTSSTFDSRDAPERKRDSHTINIIFNYSVDGLSVLGRGERRAAVSDGGRSCHCIAFREEVHRRSSPKNEKRNENKKYGRA
jgi:hypothetical protein